MRSRHHYEKIGFAVLFLFLTACTAILKPMPTSTPMPPVGSCAIEKTFPTDEETISAVLNAESQFVAAKDIDTLMKLWIIDGVVSDAFHTPNDPSDDHHWRGQDAIRQRYVYRVFASAPSEAHPKTFEITISDDHATAIGTTRIGDEVSPGGDRWELLRENDCWVIQSLTFNLENP